MTETQAAEKTQAAESNPPRRRNSTCAHLRLANKLYRRMQERARAEGQTLSAWLKQAAVKELRRKREPL
jgi:predicted HicB family RNase H-like nuclease